MATISQAVVSGLALQLLVNTSAEKNAVSGGIISIPYFTPLSLFQVFVQLCCWYELQVLFG